MPIKRRPEEYKILAAYGKYLGSNDHFISRKQREAAQDNAPLNCTYKNGLGVWVTLDDYVEQTATEIKSFL